MTEQDYVCQLCGSDQIEKFSDFNWLCKNCGLGTNGKPAMSFEKHLKDVATAVSLAELMFPHLTKIQLTFRVQFHLHRTENHPEIKDGYCEVCMINYSKLSKEDFFEKTGVYNKERWIN